MKKTKAQTKLEQVMLEQARKTSLRIIKKLKQARLAKLLALKEFEHLMLNICKGDAEIEVVTQALGEALALYQWEYQEATDRAKKVITDQLYRALKIVTDHLDLIGQYTLLKDLEDAFDRETTGLNRINLLELAREHMKSKCIGTIDAKRYDRYFAPTMKRVFIEWCKLYPLNEVPEHFDMNFEPAL